MHPVPDTLLDSFQIFVSRPLETLCEYLSEFFRQVLDQIWPPVKLSRSGLEEVDVPAASTLGGDQGLMRVEGGIQVRLAWWHHSNDGAQKSDFRTHQLHASDFADVGGRLMIGKDLPKRRSNRPSSDHLTPIEADGLPILSERGGERLRAVLIPALDDLSIEGPDGALIGRWCGLLVDWR